MSQSLQPPAPIRPDLKSEWMLDPSVAFLNHGSFGAMPKCVFVEQTRWRMRVEAEPIELLARRGSSLLEASRWSIGQWLGMDGADFGFVTNATEGINAVLRSMDLRPGDELLTTTHVYNAVRQAMKYAAGRAGATYREIEVPLPVASPDEIVGQVIHALREHTRLVVIDHITSPTALIFPVERIAAECARRGIEVLVDGAHAPGMVPLDVPKIGATYYAGNLHKWACAPKGCGFLWVRRDHQANVHPLVISHDLGAGFAREFAWQGTRDISAWLSVPRALQFMADLGWDQVMAHNHGMAVWVQQMLCDRWGVTPISPIEGSMLGSMVAVPLPPPLDCTSDAQSTELQQRLYTTHHVEVPLMRWGGRTFVRPCCQVYNGPEEYERLASLIPSLTPLALPTEATR